MEIERYEIGPMQYNARGIKSDMGENITICFKANDGKF